MAGGLPPSGFGESLKRVRTAAGVTQRELGEKAGIHANTVARLERGEVEPSWQVVIAAAKALGVDCTAFSGQAEAEQTAPQVTPSPSPKPVAKKPARKKPGGAA